MRQPKNLRSNINEVAKLTRGEYAGEAAKGFLTVLEAVMEAIPVPGFSIVVNLAVKIIKACEEGHATLERAQELKLRMKALVFMLVNELKGKKEGEICAQMIQDIGTLKGDFYIIQMQLNEITSQHPLRLILFRSLNDNNKVCRCVARLDTSLKSFELARNIEHTDMLTKLEQQIATFHAQQQQNTQTLADIQLSMVDVKAILTQGSPAHSTSSPTRALIPANMHIFHSRDTLVTELVDVLVEGP
ncbi:hypothetical protein DXG01_003235 [Tephrocybe rancida]|nr:hypothetical protein DXG01_003235 [Tephrocybe rancida]